MHSDVKNQGIYAIVIDSSLPEEERQFGLAHELIHYVRHKGSEQKVVALLEFDSSCEKEANNFAARFLWWVKRELSRKTDKKDHQKKKTTLK